MFKHIWKSLFVIYILMVLNFIVIKFNGNIHQLASTIKLNKERRLMDEGSGMNLVPFQTIETYVTDIGFSVALINILGNIIPFIPMGFLIPMVFASQRNLFKTLFSCFLIICSIESLQLIFFLGTFDIDDIIMNLFSCLLGFMLFSGYKKAFIKLAKTE